MRVSMPGQNAWKRDNAGDYVGTGIRRIIRDRITYTYSVDSLFYVSVYAINNHVCVQVSLLFSDCHFFICLPAFKPEMRMMDHLIN